MWNIQTQQFLLKSELRRYQVEVAVSEYSIEEENRILTQMRRDGIRGYIIWPVKDGDDRLLSQLSTATPIVLLDRPVPGLHVPYVTSNNYAGGLQAMEHLIRALI